jgi:hypothetical protein
VLPFLLEVFRLYGAFYVPPDLLPTWSVWLDFISVSTVL